MLKMLFLNIIQWFIFFICMLIVVHKLISVKLNWSAPNNLIFFKQKKLEKKSDQINFRHQKLKVSVFICV